MTELMRRRRALMAVGGGSSPIIPSDYQQVAWIGFGEGQTGVGVNTGITCNNSYRVVAKITKLSNSDMVFPNAYSGTIGATQWGTVSNISGSKWTCAPSYAANDLFESTEITATKTTATGSATIFLGYDGQSKYVPESRYETYKIYDANDVLLFDGVPIRRKTDNKPGFYDLVSQVARLNIVKNTSIQPMLYGADV